MSDTRGFSFLAIAASVGRNARLANLWHTGRFLCTRHSLLSQNFCNYFPRPASVYCAEHVCTYTHVLTAYRLYMNYRCYQTALQWNVWTQIGAVRSVGRLFIFEVPTLRWLGEYVTWIRRFYSLLLKQEAAGAAPVTAMFCFYCIRRRGIFRNIIITLCFNYIIVFINNNAVINNNNYGSLQYRIVLFKIPMCTRKGFFEIYKEFGHSPPISFIGPDLDCFQHDPVGQAVLVLAACKVSRSYGTCIKNC